MANLLQKNILQNIKNAESFNVDMGGGTLLSFALSNGCEKFYYLKISDNESSLVRAYRFDFVNFGFDELTLFVGKSDLQTIKSLTHNEKNPFVLVTQKADLYKISYKQETLNIMDAATKLRRYVSEGEETTHAAFKENVAKFIRQCCVGEIDENKLTIY